MSYLRRAVGVLALFPVMTALTVFGGGERERYQGEDFDKYACVTLRELQRVPTNYKNARVRFLIRYHRTENLWAPFYTPFTPEDYLAFSGWAPEKKLWVKEDHLADFPFLYINKRSPDLNLVIQAPPYQVMELYGIVRNDFNNIPWVEVIHIVPCREPIIHDKLLHHMIRGLAAVKASRMEEGLGHLHEALHHDPPLDAAVDIHIGMANAYLAQKNWHEASRHANHALELCPHHPDAEAILSHAERMLHASAPATEQRTPEPPKAPAPQPSSGPPAVEAPPVQVLEDAVITPGGDIQPLDPATPSEEAGPPAGEPEPPGPEGDQPRARGVLAAAVVPPVATPDELSDARPTPQPHQAAPAPVPSVAPAPDGAEEFRRAIEERDRKIAALAQAIDEARRATDDEVERLSAEVARLRGDLATRDEQLAKQVKVSVDLESRLRDALAKLETAARETASADERIRAAQQELAALRAKLAATEEERDQLAAALEAARQVPATGEAAVNPAIATLQARVAELEAENAALRAQVAEMEALRAENASLKEQVTTITAWNVEFQNVVKELQDRLAETSGGNEAARVAYDAAALIAERDELSNRVSSLSAERDHLASELSAKIARIAEMEQRIRDLEAAAQQALLAARAGRIVPVQEIARTAPPPKPRGRFVGFDCRPPEVVREEIRRYREWLERTPGAAEAAVEVDDELFEPGLAARKR